MPKLLVVHRYQSGLPHFTRGGQKSIWLVYWRSWMCLKFVQFAKYFKKLQNYSFSFCNPNLGLCKTGLSNLWRLKGQRASYSSHCSNTHYNKTCRTLCLVLMVWKGQKNLGLLYEINTKQNRLAWRSNLVNSLSICRSPLADHEFWKLSLYIRSIDIVKEAFLFNQNHRWSPYGLQCRCECRKRSRVKSRTEFATNLAWF